MKILALDAANLTGFAHSDGHRGTWQLAHENDRHPGARCSRLRARIIRAFEAWGFERLAYEASGFGTTNRHTQAMHDRLRGVIELTAHQLAVECWPVNPSTLNKWATGYGRARDRQIILAAKTLLGVDTDSPDVADACFILEMARQNVMPERAAAKKKRESAVRSKVRKLFK